MPPEAAHVGKVLPYSSGACFPKAFDNFCCKPHGFLGAFWDPSGSLLVIKACLGPCLEPAWGLLGACLEPAWGLLGACLGRAWGLLGACLGPAWGLLGPVGHPPGRETPSGGRALFGGKSPGWGLLGALLKALLGALGPAQGPLGMATPGGGRKCQQNPWV